MSNIHIVSRAMNDDLELDGNWSVSKKRPGYAISGSSGIEGSAFLGAIDV